MGQGCVSQFRKNLFIKMCKNVTQDCFSDMAKGIVTEVIIQLVKKSRKYLLLRCIIDL